MQGLPRYGRIFALVEKDYPPAKNTLRANPDFLGYNGQYGGIRQGVRMENEGKKTLIYMNEIDLIFVFFLISLMGVLIWQVATATFTGLFHLLFMSIFMTLPVSFVLFPIGLITKFITFSE